LEKGQHFLIDKEVLKKELEVSDLSRRDRVIEIGAGEGVITSELAKRTKEVLSFEVDKKYKEKLELIKNEYNNLRIIYGDATQYNWKGYDKIVSNIPYYLGEKIIIKSALEGIPFLTLIVGEKFRNIMANSKTKSGVIANIFYDIEPIEKIEKDSFYPAPRVNSWLIKFANKGNNKGSDFIRFVLGRKGKTKNALLYAFVKEGYTKNEAKRMLKEFNIDERILEKPVSRMTARVISIIYKKIEKIID